MSRGRHKKGHKHLHLPPPASSPAALRQNGLTAFRRNDFSTAIAQWGRLDLESEPAVRPALAEAHFRRALVVQEAALSIAELTRSLELMPAEARYRYQLGLAYHRADRLSEALDAYARASDSGFRRGGVCFARGLAEVERNPHIDLGALAWLPPEDRAALSPIAALLRGDPQAALISHPDGWVDGLKDRFLSNSASGFWRGLAHLSAGQAAQALDALSLPRGQSLPVGAEAVRAFHLGMALAATGDREGALAAWTAAASRKSTPRLEAAITDAHVRRVGALRDAGRWAEVVTASRAALRLAPGERAVTAAALVAHHRLANEAATRGAWKEAVAHWEEMRGFLATDPVIGPSAPILHNLAVAHERLEQWEAAAEAWRALMGTLPRRQPRTIPSGPDGRSPTVLERRNWLRRRVLDDYRKAGRVDEAIAVYRQAVKASPDDLDLRLELADALLANDQQVAGRNELNRILEKDPKHPEAMVRLAEAHVERGEEREAERLLRAALGVDPECDPARRGLVEVLRQRGHERFNAGHVTQSVAFYRAGLELAPEDVDLLVSLGHAELKQRNQAGARAHFEAALSRGEAAAYLGVLRRWVCEENLEEARRILARAEAAGVASAYFYIDAAKVCFDSSEPSFLSLLGPLPAKKGKRTSDHREGLGRELLQKAEAARGDLNEVLQRIVQAISWTQPALALGYAQRLADRLPDDPLILAALGMAQCLNDQDRAARASLRRAEDLARKQGNSELLAEIERMRRSLNNPLLELFSRMAPFFESVDE